MDYIDIRLNVFEHIDKTQDLLTMCIIDKLSIKIASSKDFWIKQFMKYKLPMRNRTYSQYIMWRKEFINCKWSLYNTTNFINNIVNPSIYYCPKINQHNKFLYKIAKILKKYNCIRQIELGAYIDDNYDIITIFKICKK